MAYPTWIPPSPWLLTHNGKHEKHRLKISHGLNKQLELLRDKSQMLIYPNLILKKKASETKSSYVHMYVCMSWAHCQISFLSMRWLKGIANPSRGWTCSNGCSPEALNGMIPAVLNPMNLKWLRTREACNNILPRAWHRMSKWSTDVSKGKILFIKIVSF